MAQRCVLDGHGGRDEDQGTNDADDPFGTTTATTAGVPNPFQFTGRENDGLAGLYYYRARYYHPALARFLGVDPVEFQAGEFNLYAYVMNNPLRYGDPHGLTLNDWTGFPTKDEHLNRNSHNRCPWTSPPRQSKSPGRSWSQDPWGARKYRADDGSECVYDSKGNLLPGEGTYNYGGGRNPWTIPHVWKDVRYSGNYMLYYDPEGSKYGP